MKQKQEVKLEVVVYDPEDETGFREYAGKWTMGKQQMLRVIQGGGIIETDHIIDTEAEIEKIFSYGV